MTQAQELVINAKREQAMQDLRQAIANESQGPVGDDNRRDSKPAKRPKKAVDDVLMTGGYKRIPGYELLDISPITAEELARAKSTIELSGREAQLLKADRLTCTSRPAGAVLSTLAPMSSRK